MPATEVAQLYEDVARATIVQALDADRPELRRVLAKVEAARRADYEARIALIGTLQHLARELDGLEPDPDPWLEPPEPIRGEGRPPRLAVVADVLSDDEPEA